MTLTKAQREKYGKIVFDYLDGAYTMDPDDAEYAANDVIAAYAKDQAARQAAMERVIAAARWIEGTAQDVEGDGYYVDSAYYTPLIDALSDLYDCDREDRCPKCHGLGWIDLETQGERECDACKGTGNRPDAALDATEQEATK